MGYIIMVDNRYIKSSKEDVLVKEKAKVFNTEQKVKKFVNTYIGKMNDSIKVIKVYDNKEE